MCIISHHSTFILPMLAALMLAGCAEERPMETAPPEPGCFDQELMDRAQPVMAQESAVTRSMRLSGTVEYRPDNVVHYVSLLGGVITATYFDLGDLVTKGQILADIKSTELTALEAKRKTLISEIEVHERNVKAAKALYEDGIGSERDLMKAESKLTANRAKLEQISADLALFSASERGDVFHIKAPVAGHVVNKNIAAGMPVVPEGDPLFTISDLSKVWVTANIYPGDIGRVRQGMAVAISTVSYPEEKFEGNIKTISQVFDEEAKVLKARIEMDNKDLRLKPGMFVDITLKDEDGGTAVRIPDRSLVFHNNKHYVVIHRDRCDVRYSEVSMVSKDNGDVFVTGDIRPGEEVLTRNQLLVFQTLQEGHL